MPETEKRPQFCTQCGKPIQDGAFCVYCGAKITQASAPASPSSPEQIEPQAQPSVESRPQAPAEAQAPVKKKKKKGLKIILICAGALALIAAILALVFYFKYWPGEFTSEQLSEIKSNAESRMEEVLDLLGFTDVDFDVSLTNDVQRFGEGSSSWFQRNYDIQYDLTTDGKLSYKDKACIVMCMDWFWGMDILLDGSKVNNADEYDLSELHNTGISSLKDKGGYFMGVNIPATDYNWAAHTSIRIDGRFAYGRTADEQNYYVYIDGGGEEFFVSDLLKHMDDNNIMSSPTSSQEPVENETANWSDWYNWSDDSGTGEEDEDRETALFHLRSWPINDSDDPLSTVTVGDVVENMFSPASDCNVTNDMNGNVVVTITGDYRTYPGQACTENGTLIFVNDSTAGAVSISADGSVTHDLFIAYYEAFNSPAGW